MQRHFSLALSAATVLAVLGLSACSSNPPRIASSATPAAPPPTSTVVAVPPTAPLPPPETLTDLLGRLADPNVPGINKVNLVEGATPESAATLDKFTNALRDNGYLPMTFAANDIAWSDKNPSNVMATIAVHTARANNGNFTFPMEFTPSPSFQGGWLLSRRTAEMLLALGNSPTATTPPSSTAPGPPAPEAPPAPPAAPPPAPAPPPEPGASPSPSP